MKWIKCSDRLPGSHEHAAFTYDKKGRISKEPYFVFSEKQWWIDGEMDFSSQVKEEITHWIPWPEKPNE